MRQKLGKIKKSALSLFKRKPHPFAVLESRMANLEKRLEERDKVIFSEIGQIEGYKNKVIAYVDTAYEKIKEEKRLRLAQAKREKSAMEKHIDKAFKGSGKLANEAIQKAFMECVNTSLDATNSLIEKNNNANKVQVTRCINDAINPALTKINATHKKLENRINDIDSYLDRFEFIKGLCDDAQERYEYYLKMLSEIDENQFLPKRLASVETRITLLEGCHNGSGKTASGTA